MALAGGTAGAHHRRRPATRAACRRHDIVTSARHMRAGHASSLSAGPAGPAREDVHRWPAQQRRESRVTGDVQTSLALTLADFGSFPIAPSTDPGADTVVRPTPLEPHDHDRRYRRRDLRRAPWRAVRVRPAHDPRQRCGRGPAARGVRPPHRRDRCRPGARQRARLAVPRRRQSGSLARAPGERGPAPHPDPGRSLGRRGPRAGGPRPRTELRPGARPGATCPPTPGQRC